MKIYVLLECEPWEGSQPIGHYTDPVRAYDRLEKLKALSTKFNTHKMYMVYEAETDVDHKSVAEDMMDRYCIDGKEHAFLGLTCTICDHTVKS